MSVACEIRRPGGDGALSSLLARARALASAGACAYLFGGCSNGCAATPGSEPRTVMSSANIALLADRGVVRITGADAGRLLQGVISNDIELLDRQPAIHAGLLSPQGKILFEFFIAKCGDGFLLETGRGEATGLAKRLAMYKLRAKVDIVDASEEYRVLVLWGAPPVGGASEAIVGFRDPRLPELGQRLLAHGTLDLAGLSAHFSAAPGDWHAHRVALGVPEGGKDYPLGDAFPHEANFDLLNGVSFTKGCFVGQEVVSRMHNRATVRRRVVPIAASAPLTSGASVIAGAVAIGTVGSVAGCKALALLRLDRAAEAKAKGEALRAAGTMVEVLRPDWAARVLPPVAAAP